MKNIPPPPPRRRRRRPVQSRRRRRRHRNGCTVTTTFKVINFITFFLWASPLLKDLQKRDLFRLQNFIRKSCSLPSQNHPRACNCFQLRENKDANVTIVNSKCFPYTRNLFQRFLRSEIAERTLA